MIERHPAHPLRATLDRSADRTDSQAPAQRAVMHVLHAARQPNMPRRIELRHGAMAIGRAVSARDAAFPNDPFVSRHHATLHIDAERRRARLIDHSRTGSFISGTRIREAELGEGEVVRVGDSFFLLRFESAAQAADETHDDFGLVGASPRLRRVRDTLRLVAASTASVLILGESGTGK